MNNLKEYATFQNKFTSNDIVCEECWFIPAVTIKCKPPYIKGKATNSWIKYRKGARPKTKKQLEESLGMPILKLSEGIK